RLGGSQVDRDEVGGRDRLAGAEPLHAEERDPRGRGRAVARRRRARGRRPDRGRGVAQPDHGLAGPRGPRRPRERRGAPLAAAPGEPARPPPGREPPEVVHRPAGVAQESVHRDHEALGVGEAHVEQILADQDVAVEERDAAGECRGLYGEDAHTPSVAIKCDNAPGRHRMSATPRKDPVAVEAEVREKIHLEILKRTGAYHANDHVLLPSGQHTTEYIEKTLVTMEPSFTEGLGAVIAKHFAQWPVDVVLSTGPGALILSHCVARAHPSRPVVIYGTKGLSGGKRRVSLPVEFQRLIRPSSKVLLVEDLVSTGATLSLL